MASLTCRLGSLGGAPKRESDTDSAAAVQSKDFGFSPGNLGRWWCGGTSTAPPKRGETSKVITAVVVGQAD
jgi:hypothetical protein